MANDAPPPRTGLSLYANLLGSSNDAPGTISSAPVSYNKVAEAPEEDENTKKQQALAASLRFQPTKRPQLAAQKAKAKAIASKLSSLPPTVDPVHQPQPQSQSQTSTPAQGFTDKPAQSLAAATSASSAQKHTAADWAATAEDDDDVNAYYAGSRLRGGRKKRKKNKTDQHVIQHDWDDIYDPSRPNNYEEYKHSDEKIREVREWKDLLYRHRMKSKTSSNHGSDSDSGSDVDMTRNRQFAPPPSMSFAPPAEFGGPPPPPPPPPGHGNNDHDDDDREYVPPASGNAPIDTTGGDAFARRMRMSGIQRSPPPPPPPLHEPPPPPMGQIARAPVRYNLPRADPDLPSNEAELEEMEMETEEPEEDAPRSLRPGQAKFAERLMTKYGWSKGQGLGREGTGVTSALYAKVDKRKKKSDAEGGGFVTPATTGRILGGTKSQAGRDADEGKFGAMSEVVRLEGMLKGIDVQAEMTREDGNIMQEIGEECNDKYGNVERVYIHPDTDNEEGALVFVHFTAPLSALRAVNALEGRVFNGNTIKARFWLREKFDKREYE